MGTSTLKSFVYGGLLLVALTGLPSKAQTATYDVSTIKPHDPNDPGVWWKQLPDGLRFTNVTVRGMIAHAWDIRSDQITGEPSWADDLRWDLMAKATDRSLVGMTYPQRNEMLKALLIDRLHLKFHMETRSGTVFRLLPTKSGLKLKPLGQQASAAGAGELKPGVLTWDDSGSAVVVKAHAVPMDRLLRTVAGEMHHTVLNETGLPANAVVDFELRWASEGNTAMPTDPDAPSMRQALEEQLGIRLESGSGPVPTFVVEGIQRPASN